MAKSVGLIMVGNNKDGVAQERRDAAPRSTIESVFAGKKNAGVSGYGWIPDNPLLQNISKRFDEGKTSFRKFNLEESDSILNDVLNHLVKLNELAWRDAVTGRLNRHAFEREIKEIIKPRLKSAMDVAANTGVTKLVDSDDDKKSPVTVAILDLNYLKPLNNFSMVHGGDVALKYMADFVYNRMRKSSDGKNADTFVRYGGDEFALIMRDCTKEQADERLINLSNDIAKASVGYGNVINPVTGKKEDLCIGRSKDGHNITLPISFAFGCSQLSLNDINYSEDMPELKAEILARTMQIASDNEKVDKEDRSKKYAGSGKIEGQFPCCGDRANAEKVIGEFFEERIREARGGGKWQTAVKEGADKVNHFDRLGFP